MFDVGGGEILLIVLAILMLFGPKKIPEIAAMFGNGMRKVRRAQDDFTRHLRDLSTELENAAASDPQPAGTFDAPLSDSAPVDAEAIETAAHPTGDDHTVDRPESTEPVHTDDRSDAADRSDDRPVVTISPAHGSISR
ncbi:MAG: twin-arginine translocase TatA/TatE family subunit [Candidatus Kapaibacterium sp.]